MGRIRCESGSFQVGFLGGLLGELFALLGVLGVRVEVSNAD